MASVASSSISSSPRRGIVTTQRRSAKRQRTLVFLALAGSSLAFAPVGTRVNRVPVVINNNNVEGHINSQTSSSSLLRLSLFPQQDNDNVPLGKQLASVAAASIISLSFLFGGPAFAENELNAKYGGGLDTSLVDQTCFVDQCGTQAKACLRDDPDCRKGLTCTAKCLGDNACITGCFARYGNQNLDNFLKCTIEDHECIKVAILPGGADEYGQEPAAPAPTVRNFDPKTLEGSWYKVVGYNPNYDCYACQRNSFYQPAGGGESPSVKQWLTRQQQSQTLRMDVEFSMPHMLPDGSPPPPSNSRETLVFGPTNELVGAQPIGLHRYSTQENVVFDSPNQPGGERLVITDKETGKPVSYSRTAHSEGEMFGLTFWENWYIIGENDANQEEFKFVFFNGKTRQNTYEGAFIYSRTPELSSDSMRKIYQIAQNAGMNPDQFCQIRNRGCFPESTSPSTNSKEDGTFRGILASTKISQLLGVEPVAARDTVRPSDQTAKVLNPVPRTPVDRPWWSEVGDYFENPHRHFEVMDKLRQPMVWPEDQTSNSQ